jgi:hypothetical protein
MLSNFCVVFAITWNVSVGGGAADPAEADLEATRLGVPAVEPQDESAMASVTATAPGLSALSQANHAAVRRIVFWQRFSTSWIYRPTMRESLAVIVRDAVVLPPPW